MGRNVITTDIPIITRDNVVELLTKTRAEHDVNSMNIDYLYNYYKGKQDIQSKIKETRVDINNIVTENRAYEIVNFKKGYMFGEPVQYICRGDSTIVTDAINELNNYMVLANKNKLDNDLAEWILIAGVGYRKIAPNTMWTEDNDEIPFKLATLDPRYTYIVRYNDIYQEPICAVTYTINSDLARTYYVYTKDKFFKVEADQVVEEQDLYLGYIPIIEYVTGNARLGAFEVVLPLLDAINNVQSLRIDDIQQHVDAILAIFGGDLDKETYDKLQSWKTLVLPDGVDAKYLTAVLDQGGVQTLVDNLYETVLKICGMPNQTGGSVNNTSGQAVIYSDGWTSAETQAKNLEGEFISSEKNFLKVVLRILSDMGGTMLKLINIEVKFGRRYADNIVTKVQALNQLLQSGIKPEIAIATVSIWNDPTDVAIQSKEYLDNIWGVDNDMELDNVREDRQETTTVTEANNKVI